MTSSISDPKGWIQNPPTTFVKINNVTSRTELNGRYALCIQYLQDKGRYNVVLVPNDAISAAQQQIMSFKSDNLQVCTTIEKYTAQYNMLRYSPEVQQQIIQYYNQLQSLLPYNIKVEYVVFSILFIVLMLMYFIGLTKVLMIISLLAIVGMLIGQDIIAGLSYQQIIKNVPQRWKLLLNEQIPFGYGTKITSNKFLYPITTVVIILLLLVPFFTSSKKSTSTGNTTTGGGEFNLTPTTTPSNQYPSITKDHWEQIYKIGYNDAIEQKELYESLPKSIVDIYTLLKIDVTAASSTTSTTVPKTKVTALGATTGATTNQFMDDEYDEFATTTTSNNNNGQRQSTTTTTQSSYSNYFSAMNASKKNPINFQTGLAFFTLYRVLSPLAFNIDGQFDIQLLIANIKMLDVWKLGIIGFAIYRIIIQFV